MSNPNPQKVFHDAQGRVIATGEPSLAAVDRLVRSITEFAWRQEQARLAAVAASQPAPETETAPRLAAGAPLTE